jgi:insulysin
MLKSISKSDVLQIFLSHVHPSSPIRSKLSVHCLSQKSRPKKISAAAAVAFEGLARNAGVAFDDAGWQEELGSNPAPTITDFENYWKGILVEPAVKPEVTQQLLAEIPLVAENHPVQDEDEDGAVRRQGVMYIEDVKAFKASLALSEEPKPLVEWGDLPTSKF